MDFWAAVQARRAATVLHAPRKNPETRVTALARRHLVIFGAAAARGGARAEVHARRLVRQEALSPRSLPQRGMAAGCAGRLRARLALLLGRL